MLLTDSIGLAAALFYSSASFLAKCQPCGLCAVAGRSLTLSEQAG
jgi:hypothetical protein